MLETYFNITVAAEWLTFIAALILLNKGTGKWRLFIVWLLLVLIAETIGWYQSAVLNIRGNSLVFNLLMIVSIPFLLWVMAGAKPVAKKRKYFYIAMLCFIVFAFSNIAFGQKPFVYNSFSDIFGNTLLTFFSGYLIFFVIRDETNDKSIFGQAYFWLALGLLFSAMGSAICNIFLDELQAYADKTKINVYGYINYTVNILLYACLIIAFICRRKTK